MSHYALEDLVRDTLQAAKEQTDVKLLVDSVSENLRRLLAGPFFLDEEYTRPARGALASHVLHLDRDRGLAVVVCAWAPQQATPIHDHSAWGVIGGVTNRVIVTHYRRNDDTEIPGFADVTEVSRVLVSETSFAPMRPPEEQLHKIENPFRDPAVTLHVFGDAGPWRHMFDPPAKRVTPFEPAENTIGI